MTAPIPAYSLLLRWLLLAGLILFGGWVSWDQGILQNILLSDPTRITLIIAVTFIAASGHCAFRSLYLSTEQEALQQIIQVLGLSDKPLNKGSNLLDGSLTGEFLRGLLQKTTEPEANRDAQLLAQVMAEQARGQHEAGWFVSGLLIKLGLLGTVIGFVLMLAPVAELESFDLADIQGLLQRMTGGMGVALNTTLLGLVCSILLGLQYLMLDRAADRLVAAAVHLAETRLTVKSSVE
ncbi:MAG: MotA/TolQ/ExbB proton channel family protein [Candidatus Thiodiazotropha weberae]|nr:MotA/TolQ/ExbB proton channel family protein [Candidatus Thiodiazotropha lotti]MCG8022316.1 MotA/TolQ/ExbB proton channel family protein [Candidatus Thiodiazotropha lotti]MCW4209491.1 MotA/TolQ/ExbB proton channel family protein [Candidatus Thiodiazotropha lotti]MCW4222285.1 MotA/TolQ/ExbB proton channel family protein [Candidatus Thiodiazotropha lotti]